MKETKHLAAKAALAVAIASLVGVSAFAESRPADETRARRDAGGAIRRERVTTAREARRGNETTNRSTVSRDSRRESGSSIDVRGSRQQTRIERRPQTRVEERPRQGSGRNDTAWRDSDRSRGSSDRYHGRGRDSRGRDDRYRGGHDSRGRDDRYRGNHDSRSRGSYHGRQPYYAHGRVSRVHRHGNGYRVWVHGARYPFYVPLAHWHRDRFRVGVLINLGGYYNPRGYYDYYDGRSAGELYGVVESVDYRRNTFVVRNDATGSFVTIIARDHEVDRLRAGDSVELYGNWARSGLFEARDVDIVDSYRR